MTACSRPATASAQAEATLEAPRDVEPNGRPLAEVATAHRFQGREFPVVVFDTVEPAYDGRRRISQASLLPGSSPWQRKGVRLFNVATTRVQHRLYVIASRDRVWRARPGTALGHLGTLLRDRQVRTLSATSLVSPATREPAELGPEGTRLAEVLARHVTITDIHAEEFSTPPSCGACEGKQVDLRRANDGSWYWRCYNPACPGRGKGKYRAWTRAVVLKTRRS